MNVQDYKRGLIELETSLSARASKKREAARAQVLDSPGDIGDASVSDQGGSQAFTEAELDATVLQQVRDALRRIENGTFGRCVVDGAPIEPRRLEAMRGRRTASSISSSSRQQPGPERPHFKETYV